MEQWMQHFVLTCMTAILLCVVGYGYWIIIKSVITWFKNRKNTKKKKVDDLQRIQEELDEIKKIIHQ